MNFDLEPSKGMPKLYDYVNNRIGRDNPVILVLLTIVIVMYYLVFTTSTPVPISNTFGEVAQSVESATTGMTTIELIMWGLFIFLVLINGVQYFFSVDIETAIKNIFSPVPEIDITLTDKFDDKTTPIPEITFEKQVFHIPDNEYTYDDAKALCKAYGSRLAKYDEIEAAYNNGAEWCGYGWSDGQMALFPTQKKTYTELQKIEGHENDCGRPGVNGGYIENPNVRFGVNCYGYKPEITTEERNKMAEKVHYPMTEKDKAIEKKISDFKKKLPDILVAPFNNSRWSQI